MKRVARRLRSLLRRPDPAAEADAVAGDLDRLAALVSAGATQPDAWTYLASSSAGSTQRLASDVAAAAARGAPLLEAFSTAPPAWRAPGAVVALAADTGAPLGRALRSAADTARRAADLHRAVATSTAGPSASTRLVLALPPITALLGWAFGFDVPGVLFGWPGVLLLVAGTALLVVAATWSRRLIAAAARTSWTLGLDLELVATAVRAGLPVPTAQAAARTIASPLGLDLGTGRELAATLDFAAAAGLPLVGLLDAEADRLRRGAVAGARVRAEALAVRLLLPLGLLVLPAFLLLGALPVGLAILSTTTIPL